MTACRLLTIVLFVANVSLPCFAGQGSCSYLGCAFLKGEPFDSGLV